MKKAFTLIELLIVVAIIAILAAIAVPNFLEAQTRSKVSRMKADMRSVATGLEAYSVDNNRYVTGFGIKVPPVTGNYGLFLLSTPIAYISSAKMKDVFDRNPSNTQAGLLLHDALDADGKIIQDSTSGPTLYTINPLAKEAAWWIASRGPDKRSGFSSSDPEWNMYDRLYNANNPANPGALLADATYDATNGTMSQGNIQRMGGAPVRATEFANR